MIAEIQALIVEAVVDQRALSRRKLGKLQREVALATLEAELEELNLQGWTTVPSGYEARFGRLAGDAHLTDAERKRLTAARPQGIGKVIEVIFDHLMEQPDPEEVRELHRSARTWMVEARLRWRWFNRERTR